MNFFPSVDLVACISAGHHQLREFIDLIWGVVIAPAGWDAEAHRGQIGESDRAVVRGQFHELINLFGQQLHFDLRIELIRRFVLNNLIHQRQSVIVERWKIYVIHIEDVG